MIEHKGDPRIGEAQVPEGKSTGQSVPIVSADERAIDLEAPRAVPAGGGQKISERHQMLISRSGTQMTIHGWRPIPASGLKAGQKVITSRRGELDKGVFHGTLSPMSPVRSAGQADSDASPISPDGVSALIARVLDQLALGSWLPAAFFVASAALVLQFRSAKSTNLLYAVRELSADPVQVLVVMVPVLIIATFVTQA
ncbi:MAG: hypothetical protein ACRDN0_02725, partial [Trebonia sp.]